MIAHVAEVEPGGVDGDPHLPGAERRPRPRMGGDPQALERAGRLHREVPVGLALLGQERAAAAEVLQARNEQGALPQGELRLAGGERRRQHLVGELAAVAVDQGEALGVLGVGAAQRGRAAAPGADRGAHRRPPPGQRG